MAANSHDNWWSHKKHIVGDSVSIFCRKQEIPMSPNHEGLILVLGLHPHNEALYSGMDTEDRMTLHKVF